MSADPVDNGRRRLLLAAVSALLVGCPVAGEIARGRRVGRGGLAEAWPRLLDDPAAAARLGRGYLADHPAYRTADSILKEIKRSLLDYDAKATLQGDSEDITSLLKGLVVEEYRQGDVVSVGGWILSTSEARLYALAAIG